MTTMNETRTARDLTEDAGASVYYWTGTEYLGREGWGPAPAPEGGARVSWSDFSSRQSDCPAFIDVPWTAWGDYNGSTVERSNARCILRDYPEHVIVVTGFHGSESLFIPADAEIPEDLYDSVVAIANDYPVWDESDMSELEWEIVTEMWDIYGSSDLPREVGAILTGSRSNWSDWEDFGYSEDDLREMLQDAYSVTGFYPYCEDAVSAILWDDRTVAHIADQILSAWMDGYGVVPECDGQLMLGE